MTTMRIRLLLFSSVVFCIIMILTSLRQVPLENVTMPLDRPMSMTSFVSERILSCRLNLESWLNPMIDVWLERDVPILDWVWTLSTNGIVQAMLITEHLREKRTQFLRATWYCHDKYTNSSLQATIMRQHKKFHGDMMMIRCNIDRSARVTKIWTSLPSNKTMGVVEYDLEPILRCDKLENDEEFDLDNTNNKIGACLRFRGNRFLVPQWIEYHRLIGVHHFWVFLNEPPDHLRGLPSEPDVTYISYNYLWAHHRNRTAFRPPYKGADFWHTAQLHHCLYNARRHNFTWVTTTDVDEYLWVSETPLIENHTGTSILPPLQRFLSQYSGRSDIGALTMKSIPFGKNTKLVEEKKSFPLLMDYTYRHIEELPCNHKMARCKCIYNAQNLNVSAGVYVKHFKNPSNGVFFSATRAKQKQLIQDTSLPDFYRAQVLRSLEKSSLYPYPLNHVSIQ